MTGLLVQRRALTPAGKLALALLCLVLTVAGGAFFLLAPARTRAAVLEGRRADLQREIAQARIAVGDVARHRLEGVELHRRLEEIAERLPTEREIPPLYRRLYEAAFSTGLALALFQPREPRILDYYAEIPITLTAEGTYHQLAAFLGRVANLPRAVTVGALKVTALERPAVSLRAEMTLATYVYRPAAAPAPGAAGPRQPALPTPQTVPPVPETAASMSIPLDPPPARPGYSPRDRRDPFGPPARPAASDASPTAGRHPLIASATLTGIVRGPDGLLALVEMPDGLGYILRAGDGIEEARVIRIRGDSVVFAIPPEAGRAGQHIVLGLGR